MCGRFVLTTPGQALARHFALQAFPDIRPRYNIAPSQEIVSVRIGPVSGAREACALRWGLIPYWAKDASIGARMINARSETADEKPSFRAAFSRRRCLVPASGFYEWQRAGRVKQPYYFGMPDERPFALAALWEQWRAPDGGTVESCALLTTAANELMRPVHDRMPVILDPGDYELWLDPAVRERERLAPLLAPYRGGELIAYPVATTVNKVANDGPGNIEPLPES